MAKILLGYSSNSSTMRSSEVDFSDVFGGPPRCSAQDLYYNEYEHLDCTDNVDNNDVFGLTEKPVYGDQVGGVRKRYTSEDFYDDIFGGDKPLLSSLSPRVHMTGRNPFASAPGSRTMSPSRKPLAPAAELSGSPSKFSLPGKISNTDYMASSLISQNSKSSGRLLSRLRQTLQSISINRPSSLSRQISIDSKESTNDSKFDGAEYEAEFITNSNDNIQFHFSIYKWANKGVPITMSSRKRSPSRPKEKNNDILVMENTNDDATTKDDSFSARKRRMAFTTQVRDEAWFDSLNVEEMNATECKTEGFMEDQDMYKSMSNESNSSKEVHEHSKKDLGTRTINISPKKTKSNMRPLAYLFGDNKEENVTNMGGKERKGKEMKQVLSDIFSTHKVNKSKVHELDHGAEEEIDKSEAPAKMKDFVKIFNQDTSAKVKSNNNGGVSQSRSWRWKDKDSNTNKFQAKNHETKTTNHDQMQALSVSLGKTWSQPIEMVDAESYISNENSINCNASDSGTKIENIKASSPNIIRTSIDDQMAIEILQDIDAQLATETQDETPSYELKVRQWSKGKEGNIRALLSTMQYILWPNSGWKPIPLVDIIEANAVKKSYQRALLCLHPDKLQQKGAAPYQKFIAERVFDILQEAWDQFNSLGLL